MKQESENQDGRPTGDPSDSGAQLSSDGMFDDPLPAERGAGQLDAGYEIVSELGHGAFGRVRRAVDRALGREVAIKTLHKRAGRRPLREGFIREARVLASVDHPNIVRIYSITESEGEIRIVLELIDGETLADHVAKQGPFSPEEVAVIGVQLARALSEIHSKGIVHRDLNPANVMRARGGRIVLLDFGLARSFDSEIDPKGTVDGAGTPLFMAPEQFERGEIDSRTDLYALGALLFWLVTGESPFDAETLHELRKRVTSGDRAAVTDRRRDVPDSLAGVIDRAMATDPNDRYSTAGAMESDLRCVRRDRSYGGAEALSPHAPLATATTKSGRRSLIISVVVLTLVIAAIALVALRPQNRFDAVAVFHRWPGDAIAEETTVLADGDSLRIGSTDDNSDSVFLELDLDRELFVYVFNEDSEGTERTLFPSPDAAYSNPLPRGRTLLPDGDHAWGLTKQRGGALEHWLVVLSVRRLPWAEELARSVASIEDLSPSGYRSLMRGVEKLVRRDPARKDSDSNVDRLSRLSSVAVPLVGRIESSSGLAIRRLTLSRVQR